MASILIELHAQLEDGRTFDVVADQRDVARWEIQDFGVPFSITFETRPMLAMRWLGWCALSRRDQLDGMTWEEFDAVCVEVADPVADAAAGDGDQVDVDQLPEAGEGTDPGRPGPSAGSSSRSPRQRAKR